MRFVVFAVLLLLGCGGHDATTSKTETFDHKPMQAEVTRRLEMGDTRALATESFDAMFAVAAKELVKAGYQREADQLNAEWKDLYRGQMLGLDGDVGDHTPLSQWVEDWYKKLEDLLGVQLMELLHLRDIWVLNYTVPVVFHAQAATAWCTEQLAKYPQDTCEDEYRRHFAGTRWEKGPDPLATAVLHHGFAGVVTYWVVWAACEAATYGSGYGLVCSPAGDLAEIAVEKWVAPKVSDKLYVRANP